MPRTDGPRSLLIVDDEESILFALGRFFSTRGFEVATADAAGPASEILAQRRFDLVVADLRLTAPAGVEGLDVLVEARRWSPATRTILLTAFDSPLVGADLRTRSVDMVLQKPQPLAELLLAVESLLGRRQEAT